jgi:F-type H+-transporting ATPase subunit gamma
MSESAVSLRRQIHSAGDLQSVVRTMKALAASSIGQYEKSVHALGDYYRAVELGLAASLKASKPEAFAVERKGMPDAGDIGAIVFGSDQGLVGQFNDMIADYAIQTLSQFPGQSRIWAVGERVQTRLGNADVQIMGTYSVPNSVKAIAPLVSRIQVECEVNRVEGEVAPLYMFHNRPRSGFALRTGEPAGAAA